MIDFTKKLGKKEVQKKLNPVEIYDTIDRKSETGPLRPAQEYILKSWYENRKNNKDLIIKLHTGEGKTLVGLLILMSKINSGEGPCICVCPNIYLVEQVCNEAQKFGIPICRVSDDNIIPEDFYEGKKILITNVYKVFNGKSIFGIGVRSTHVNTIIIDDSHACIESIKEALTFNIPSKNGNRLYILLKELFEDDLKEQGEGSYYELESINSEVVLPIPYWSWLDKKSEVIKLLSQYLDENYLKFTWPILRDRIEYCQAHISNAKFEIAPLFIPINEFGVFSKAEQRVLMSATTQEDSFFIKGLNFGVDAVKNPLSNPNQKWSGEKMILIPSMIADEMDREYVLSSFVKSNYNKFGAISLVSSFKKAEYYKQLGAIVVDGDGIFREVAKLKNGIFSKMVVLVNRYDGIDLPDNSCRILFLDSLPYFDSLNERYEQQCRSNSDILNIRLAQKIEQGLGRSVRGEKDYSVIIITGSDLVKFLRSARTKKYFSAQTQKQIDIGIEITKMAQEDIEENIDRIKIVSSLIDQSLKRDEGWKSYYIEMMEDLEQTKKDISVYDTLNCEKKAFDALASLNRPKALELVQKIIDATNDDLEKGWYLQLKAYISYFDSKVEANKTQIAAFKKNPQLLKPKEGIVYKKIGEINQNRLNAIRDNYLRFAGYEDFSVNYSSFVDDLTFGVESEKFENAFLEIGLLLGFESQRPDKEIRKGPDNLWYLGQNKYMLFECKNEVSENRSSVSKKEAGQMDQHCKWFEDEYGFVFVKPLLVIATKDMAFDAYLPKDTEIMRKSRLNDFKTNIRNFIKEFHPYSISDVDDKTISDWLSTHKLDVDSLLMCYSEKPFRKTK